MPKEAAEGILDLTWSPLPNDTHGITTASWIYFTFLQQQVPRMQGRIPEAAQNPLKVPTLDSYTGSKGRGGKGREDGRGSGCVYKEMCAKEKRGADLKRDQWTF